MHNDRPRSWLAILGASLLVLGLLVTAISPDAKADGGEPISIQTINHVPLGDYKVNLHLGQALGPEDIGTMPIMEINNTAEIVNYTGPGGKVIIPSIVQYPIEATAPSGDLDEPLGIHENVVRVSSIAAEAFKGRTDIESITIPEGVDKIGASAFFGCTNLTQLLFLGSTMPGNVSDWWLNGTAAGLVGYASYCSAIDFLGTDFNGLMVYNPGPPVMSGSDLGPPQASLSGRIADQSGKPMPGVTVTAANGWSSTTDAGGRFLLMAPLGLGNFTVSGAMIETASFFAYLGLGGTETGSIQVSMAESGDPHTAEAVGLMVGVFLVAVALLTIGLLASGRRRKE
jgi:hypothetical protein